MSEATPTVRAGARVRLHFRLALEDGTVADASFGGEPLAIVMGDGTLHPNLERVLVGLRAGAHETFTIEPLEGFGFADPEAVHTLPRSEFPAEMALAPGTIVGFATPGGEAVPGIVKAVSEDEVTVDFSHPLAGHRLRFEVEILEVGDGG